MAGQRVFYSQIDYAEKKYLNGFALVIKEKDVKMRVCIRLPIHMFQNKKLKLLF